jgi:hypothetical protein
MMIVAGVKKILVSSMVDRCSGMLVLYSPAAGGLSLSAAADHDMHG